MRIVDVGGERLCGTRSATPLPSALRARNTLKSSPRATNLISSSPRSAQKAASGKRISTGRSGIIRFYEVAVGLADDRAWSSEPSDLVSRAATHAVIAPPIVKADADPYSSATHPSSSAPRGIVPQAMSR